jgi:hypothetical protein
MNEIGRLQQMLQRTYDGKCFHGDSIQEVLNNIDAAQSVWIPDGASHSIWQIVLHMTGWLNAIRRRLTSPTLINLTDEENFPAVPLPTHENWHAARDSFGAALEGLIGAAGEFPESRLEEKVPGRDYTFFVLLHGAIDHNLYHLGQISLLKAMYRGSTVAAGT